MLLNQYVYINTYQLACSSTCNNGGGGHLPPPCHPTIHSARGINDYIKQNYEYNVREEDGVTFTRISLATTSSTHREDFVM
jgi:hypothetical protein